MLAQWIAWFFTNFGLAMLIIAAVIIVSTYRFSPYSLAEVSYRWLALLPLGITGLYSFVMHGFFGGFTAATIGWADSPFQYEVAMANLGFGLIAILSFKASLGFRKAVVIGNACWLWGDATGHVYQMVTQHNYTVGNAGSWFWMDVLLPLLAIMCVIKMARESKS